MTQTLDAVSSQRAFRPHTSYRHEAVFYRGHEEYMASIVPFIQEAVRGDQGCMVAVPGERLRLLQDAFERHTTGVHFVDMTVLGRNPARVIGVWQQFVEQHPGPVRGVVEPVWAGRRPEEIVECQLHEALMNLAIDPDTPLWLRCPYDLDALSTQIIDGAHRSHPVLVDGDDIIGSRSYGGVTYANETFSTDLPAPKGRQHELEFFTSDIHRVRSAVLRFADQAGVATDRAGDLATAMHEAATNSTAYGGGSGTLRIWRESGALVCEIRDAGQIAEPLVGRRTQTPSGSTGRRLWMVEQLCDLTQIRSTADQTIVRVFTWL